MVSNGSSHFEFHFLKVESLLVAVQVQAVQCDIAGEVIQIVSGHVRVHVKRKAGVALISEQAESKRIEAISKKIEPINGHCFGEVDHTAEVQLSIGIAQCCMPFEFVAVEVTIDHQVLKIVTPVENV